MKFIKYIFSAVILFAAVCAISSCRVASHNGKLDGQWQIMSIEETATGLSAAPETRSYLCFYLHILQAYGPTYRLTANMTYDKEEEVLTADFPYISQGDVDKNLKPYGICSNPVTIEVVKADSKELVLRTPETVITCRRF
ncbi:MAG: lipocalin-like domain-containing protein [Muribaculaceae bacterium]|nr:lipocalin-like domain-containing protein [Muribaculaceae bacterium]